MASEDIIQAIKSNITEAITESQTLNVMGGGVNWLVLGLGLGFLFIFLLVFYIYFAIAWSTIAKKLKYPHPWLAWIPIAKTVMLLQLGGFSGLWALLILIPILGWIALGIMCIVAKWRIFEKRKHPGWFALAPIMPQVGWILNAIAVGIVAWQDKK